MDRIFLCSFGNSSYLSSLSRLRAQAEETGWFYRVECSTEKNLSAFFRQEAADLLKQEVRGFGYWIWKPQILLQCLQQMEYGDILLYTDAGCHINEVGKNMFLAYIKEVKKHPSGFLVFGARKGSLERQYTKGDIFSYFGIQEDDDIYNSGQIHATTFFLRKDDKCLSPIKPIQQQIDERTKFFEDKHVIGMHIRRGDHTTPTLGSPLSLFISKIEEEVTLDPNTYFYVASDSFSEKKKLKDLFGERIITRFDEVRRDNESGIVDALVELYTLAHTSKIYGSLASSYSSLAAELYSIKLEILSLV